MINEVVCFGRASSGGVTGCLAAFLLNSDSTL